MKKWTIELPIAPQSRKEAEDVWNGITSRVEIGSNQVIVEGIEAENQEEARRIAASAANRLLDQLSVLHGASHEVVFEARNFKIVNEETDERTGIAQVSVSVVLTDSVTAHDRVMIEKRDSSGRVIATHDSDKPGKLPGVTTDAMSYYRRGAVSENLYERMRNKCLAIENIVSLICSRDSLPNGGTSCYQHAFKVVYADAQNARNLEIVWKGSGGSDLEELAEYVYEHIRCQLAHAKDNKAKRLPYDENDVATVKRGQNVVERVVQDLIRYQLAGSL